MMIYIRAWYLNAPQQAPPPGVNAPVPAAIADAAEADDDVIVED